MTLCLLVIIGFLGIARWIRGELRDSYAQVVEEHLIDDSRFFAAYLESQRMSTESLQSLARVLAAFQSQVFKAKIYDYLKSAPSIEMYVTDTKGKVIFSTQENLVGKDFSKWNDVLRTLRGEYGARSTRTDPKDSRSSVYYVAAPIYVDSKIAGVVTVYKTETSILVFLDRALVKMFMGGLFSVTSLGLVGGLIMIWITRPLEKLRRYALDISEGKRASISKSNIKEIAQLTDAFEHMRVSLEGKKTVEQYTQILTHELKSPLTAIRGAAELCLEEMDSQLRVQFLESIIEEARRSHSILEQLLKIAAIESIRELENTEPIDLVEILNEAKDALFGQWKSKALQIQTKHQSRTFVNGDRFLLFQAIRNILQNAIEFSEANGTIICILTDNDSCLKVEISDDGVGIPPYALNRIFEKFYSLERPDSKKKSSGLGLSFVKSVVELHRGQISIASPISQNRGTRVNLIFP